MTSEPAQPAPDSRQLGDSGLFVTPIGLGCWPIAGMTSLDVQIDESRKTLAAALDAGINFFDTAHCYGIDGISERLVGEAIGTHRDHLVIATKGGIHWDSQGQRHYDGRPATLMNQCETSLRRMGIERIDLYYLHAADPATPVEESAVALARLLDQGKIRAAGVSNLTVQQMAAFQSVCPITAAQPPFNMLQQQIQDDLVPWCQQREIAIVSYWPLMKGLLAGKIRRGYVFDPRDSRLNYDVFQGEAMELAQQLLDELDWIAEEIGRTIAQIVVNWTCQQPGISAVLCGAKRDWQIRETAGALGWRLTPSQIQRIDCCLQQLTDQDRDRPATRGIG